MNAPATKIAEEIPTVPGTPFQGGFYVGRFQSAGNQYGLVVAPRKLGDRKPGMWSKKYEEIAGAKSFCDGLANTKAMAEAKLAIAQWALELSIDGYTDWYLPARDELELCYRYLKPTEQKNWVYRHGENPSAVPMTYPYTAENPLRTEIAAFQAGGAEAFDDTRYWSSTQYSALSAWCQYFDDGLQGSNAKGSKLRARAVRRFLII